MFKIYTTLFCSVFALSIFSQNDAILKIASRCCNGDDGINCLTLIVEYSDGRKIPITTSYDYGMKQNGIARIEVFDSKKNPLTGNIRITYEGKTLETLKIPIAVRFNETYDVHLYKIDTEFQVQKADQLCDEPDVIRQEIKETNKRQEENKSKKKSNQAKADSNKLQLQKLKEENSSLQSQVFNLLDSIENLSLVISELRESNNSTNGEIAKISKELKNVLTKSMAKDSLILLLENEISLQKDSMAVLGNEISAGDAIVNSLSNYLIPRVVEFEWSPFSRQYSKKAKKFSDWESTEISLKTMEEDDEVSDTNLYLLITVVQSNLGLKPIVINELDNKDIGIRYKKYFSIAKDDIDKVRTARIVNIRLLFKNPYNRKYKVISSLEYIIDDGTFVKRPYADKKERKDYIRESWESLDHFIYD